MKRTLHALVAVVSVPAACHGGVAPGGVAPAEPRAGVTAAGGASCVDATERAGGEKKKNDAIVFDDARAEVRVDDPRACLRTYRLSSTAKLRDGIPTSPRVVTERAGAPRVRTGNAFFDALHALAVEEVREASVASIHDDSFDDGRPLACAPGGCFETGRKWTYVWTRDTAYSAHLGLAMLDPARTRSSLEFKLSERRGGGGLEIVQDTGSGGSWPVSTDRVTWALGASRVLLALDGKDRIAFRDRAFEAIRNTIERDRLVVFDPDDGLYRGEESFLDWRVQSYPEWTGTDTLDVGLSKSLSTNVVHYAALTTAAQLANERGDAAHEARYRAWADALRTSIRQRLWLEARGLFSAYLPTTFDPAPVGRFELLGQALAVLTGVADEKQAAAMLRSYPYTGAGPAVVWPEQRGIAIYHNRATWPFVTAYWMLAARTADDDAVADLCVDSLVRGAAKNLSNMENLELVTGRSWVDEGPLSGPVVDSQRQLWSIAGYVAMVHDGIFGREISPDGIRFRPYVTRGMHRAWFADAESIVLDGLEWRGKHMTVVVRLPPLGAEQGGAYRIASVRVNGQEVGDAYLAASALAPSSRVDVTLAAEVRPAGRANVVAASDARTLYAPSTPRVAAVDRVARGLRLKIDTAGEPSDAVTIDVYRDGKPVAHDLPGSTREWTDADLAHAGKSPCYVIESVYVGSKNASYHSKPACFWGARGEKARTLPARANGEVVEVGDVRANVTGVHDVQLLGSNPGDVTTGVTCAVARLTVESVPDAKVVGRGYVFMPHTGDPAAKGASSLVPVRLEAGHRYKIRIDHDENTVNMSAFQHFVRYTRGRGGKSGAENTMKVESVRLYERD